jgi:Zn-dependent protease
LIYLPPAPFHLILFALSQLIWLNLYWNLVNLLPVLPLDGGRICQEICSVFSVRYAMWYAAWIGVAVGGLAAAYFFANEDRYAGVMFVMLCMSNVSIIQQGRAF